MKSIDEAVTKLLTDRLQKRVDQRLNRETCVEIYQDIFYTLTEIFKESQAPLGNESANLLSQMYYDCVTVKSSAGPMELDPTIFDKRASMDNIPTKELALLASMMTGTPFASVFISEVKKRS